MVTPSDFTDVSVLDWLQWNTSSPVIDDLASNMMPCHWPNHYIHHGAWPLVVVGTQYLPCCLLQLGSLGSNYSPCRAPQIRYLVCCSEPHNHVCYEWRIFLDSNCVFAEGFSNQVQSSWSDLNPASYHWAAIIQSRANGYGSQVHKSWYIVTVNAWQTLCMIRHKSIFDPHSETRRLSLICEFCLKPAGVASGGWCCESKDWPKVAAESGLPCNCDM